MNVLEQHEFDLVRADLNWERGLTRTLCAKLEAAEREIKELREQIAKMRKQTGGAQ